MTTIGVGDIEKVDVEKECLGVSIVQRQVLRVIRDNVNRAQLTEFIDRRNDSSMYDHSAVLYQYARQRTEWVALATVYLTEPSVAVR